MLLSRVVFAGSLQHLHWSTNNLSAEARLGFGILKPFLKLTLDIVCYSIRPASWTQIVIHVCRRGSNASSQAHSSPFLSVFPNRLIGPRLHGLPGRMYAFCL